MNEENRKSYEAQLKAEVAVLTEMVRVLSDRIAQMDSEKRPQNCGTGYCSCIECVMKPEDLYDLAVKADNGGQP